MRLLRLAAAAVLGVFISGCEILPAASDSQRGEIETLSTWPTGHGVAVYAAGDIADCRNFPAAQTAAAATAALIEAELAKDPDAVVLTLGDNTYPVGKPEEFRDCYDPTWGKFKSRTRPSAGNHDYATPGAAGYFDYFGDLAGPARRGYYSFVVNGWLVLSLDSNLASPRHAEQLEWLQAALAKSEAKCILAFWHHPLFSSGGHGDRPQMREAWRLLRQAGAELVLSAHDHSYERLAPQDEDGRKDNARGLRQFVVGTGGATLGTFRFMKSTSEAAVIFRHGVLKLVLYPAHYEWEFLPIPESSNHTGDRKDRVLDSGKGRCR